LAGCARTLIYDKGGERRFPPSDAIVGEVIEDVPHLISKGDPVNSDGLS
jgi:hypothetical protein